MSPTSFVAEPLAFAFFRWALVEAVLVGALCGLLGGFVVLRRLAFLSDALPHFLFPGVVIATVAGVEPLLGGLVAALVAVVVVARLARQRGVGEDAATGIVFVGLFALGIVLLSRTRTYAQSLSALLFGNLLAVGPVEVAATAAIGVVVVAAIGLLYKEWLLTTFDPAVARAQGLPVGRLDFALLALIALAATVAVGAVGNTLVVGLLVTPAATARLLTRRFPTLLALGAGLGAVSGAVGLYLSYHLGWASGATITVTASALFAAALLLAPRDGLAPRLLARAGTRRDPFAETAP